MATKPKTAVLAPQPTAPAVRKQWTETDFNWAMRSALAVFGFRALHIREASEVGVSDLMVYHRGTIIKAWLELKIVDLFAGRDGQLDPGQVQFMRDHWRIGRNAMVVRYHRRDDRVVVSQGDQDPKGLVVSFHDCQLFEIDWPQVFTDFAATKN